MGVGLTRGTVLVADYDPEWPARFAEERARLTAALDGVPAAIEHVGSTAVPGLAAKPVIDVAVGRPPESDLEPYVRAFTGLGYEYKGENGIPGRHFFGLGQPRTHHLHLVEFGGELWRAHLAFRDHLRRHPERAAAYAALKRDLATRFPDDRVAYTDAKAPFITEILREALGDSAD